MDDKKTGEDAKDNVEIDKATTHEQKNKPNQKNKGMLFLMLLIGILIGVLIMFFVYQNQSKETIPVQETNSNETVEVDITTQITEVVKNVSPAVVGITNMQTQYENFWREDQSLDDEAGTGSGVIYKTSENDAFVVTNHHVIEDADNLEVVLPSEVKLEAELLGSDLFMDLAVLKVAAEDIEQVIEIGTSEDINVGEPVLAIGNPLGHMFAGSVTQGIISSKQRSIPQDFNQDGRADWQAELIQTDAAINPGNSGGALINIKGELIGINSMKISQMVAEGIGFAIPIDVALPVIEELEKAGEVSRPHLGVELYSLDELPNQERLDSLDLPEDITEGAYIWSVEPGSPAEEAGLQQFDVIVEIEGKEIESSVDLRKILYEEKSIDDEITITVYRKAEKIETKATLVPQEK